MSVFTKEYWRSAARELKNPRVITLAGLVCAFSILLESMPIYLMGPTLKIYFSFLFVAMGAWVCGPVVAMLGGAITDTVGFLLAGYGEPYFPGYLVTALLSGLVYGCFLYRQKPTLLRLLLTKAVVNFGLNVALGCVWKAMLYGKTYYYYFVAGLWKNAVLLPIETALLVIMFRYLEKHQLDKKYIHKS